MHGATVKKKKSWKLFKLQAAAVNVVAGLGVSINLIKVNHFLRKNMKRHCSVM
jgi:hypothetical protein